MESQRVAGQKVYRYAYVLNILAACPWPQPLRRHNARSSLGHLLTHADQGSESWPPRHRSSSPSGYPCGIPHRERLVLRREILTAVFAGIAGQQAQNRLVGDVLPAAPPTTTTLYWGRVKIHATTLYGPRVVKMQLQVFDLQQILRQRIPWSPKVNRPVHALGFSRASWVCSLVEIFVCLSAILHTFNLV